MRPFDGEKRIFDSMHTRIEIMIPRESGAGCDPQELVRLAEQAVRKCDLLFNPFGENSDVKKLNEAGAGRWVEVDPLTMILTLEALKWHQVTGGIFDPTIGPLKRLFQFENKPVADQPTTVRITETRRKVGIDKLQLDHEGGRLAFAESGMALDLCGLAKGFAADLAAEVLASQGVENALINVGGEIRSLGINPGSGPWRVRLADPNGGDTSRYLAEVSNRGLATSGNYESFFEYEGKRYSHIIDPKTGCPLGNAVVGVTVSHPTHATVAEALSTTLSVLGPAEGEEFLRRRAGLDFRDGLEVIMFTAGPDLELETRLMIVEKGGTVTVSQP